MYPIITRAEWGAKHGSGALDPGPEENVVIHHSYSPALLPSATPAQEKAAWLGIERYHVENNGWDGIGYNFGATPAGRILEGRGWKFRGAHAGPANSQSIGICLLINGSKQDPTPEMMQAVRDLIALGVQLGEIAPTYKISGHRDWMPRECPGDRVYRRLHEFKHDFMRVVTPMITPGTRVWSGFTGEHLVVTRYISNHEWYFLPESELKKVPAHRAQTPFSQMPAPRF